MKNVFKKSNTVYILWVLCIIFNLFTFLFVYYRIHPSGKTLALHYNVIIGVDWYGSSKNIYTMPTVGLGITAINFVLYRLLKRTGIFMGELAAFTSFCIQVTILIATIFLSHINV